MSGNTVYCGDIHIQGTAYLEPGLFHIVGGKFKVNSDASVHTVDVNGDVVAPESVPEGNGANYGQTIFLDSSHKNDIIEINGGSNAVMLAPNDPSVFNVGSADNIVNSDSNLAAGLAGMLFYQTDQASDQAHHKFNGGSTMFLDGAIYAPVAECQFNGNGEDDIGKLMLVCGQIDFVGESYFHDTPLNSALENNPYLQDFYYAKLVD